jgi:hypothetical protein
LRERLGRVDFAAHAGQLLIGHVELKAPGKGANPERYKGHDREQWERFKDLPNLIYTDGNDWALYRSGGLDGKRIRLHGDVCADGAAAVTSGDAQDLFQLLAAFSSWTPIVTPDGLPLAYEVLPGNTSDKTTLRDFLQRIEARYGRAAGLVAIRVPAHGEPLNRATFVWRLDVGRYKKAENRDGKYILRTNLLGEAPETLWTKYIQLTQIEAAFKCLKSDLALRPICHQVEPRVEAHILVAFLGYSLMATLRKRLEVLAPGLTPKAALETLAGIQMLDVSLPTTDGRTLVLPRYTQPEPEQALLLQRLRLRLPKQPPPRIRVAQVRSAPSFCSEDSKKPPLAPQGLTSTPPPQTAKVGLALRRSIVGTSLSPRPWRGSRWESCPRADDR